MVDSDFDREKSELAGGDELSGGDLELGIRREPSFSGWCDENGVLYSGQLENKDANVNDFDFELPLQQIRLEKAVVDRKKQDFSEGKQRMEADGDIREHHRQNLGNESNNYEPFDIENGSRGDFQNYSNAGDCDANCINNHNMSHKKVKLISAADILKTLFFILVWYTFSTFLTLYNKTLLGDELGKFPAPLLMNTVHFAMQAVFSRAITFFCSQRFQPTVSMSWRDFFVRVVPTALSTAMDINLSNESLVFISVTFATMCKSAAPIFLLLFAFAFRLESPSYKLLGIISVISVGILLTVSKERQFDFWGFVFVMLAAVMSGFRWTMTQILLQKEVYGLKNPITLMSYVTPVMAVATAFLSLILDPWHEFKTSNYFDSSWHIARSCLLMVFGGALAFFMVLTEYILLSVTSAVTVTIAGVVKEAVTILVAVFYFHDKFTWLKGAGLVIILIGVSLFNLYKYQKLQQGETTEDEPNKSTGNTGAKYVILEEMDDLDDGPGS